MRFFAALLALALAGAGSVVAEDSGPSASAKPDAIVPGIPATPAESPSPPPPTPSAEQARSEKSNQLADLVEQSLRRAEKVELLWLLSYPYTQAKPPVRPKTREVVDGLAVYAKSALRSPADLDLLSRSVVAMIRDSQGGGAKCFYPGPTLRFRLDGQPALLTLCFACGRGELRLGEASHNFTIEYTLGSEADTSGAWLPMFKRYRLKPELPRVRTRKP